MKYIYENRVGRLTQVFLQNPGVLKGSLERDNLG